MATLLEKVVQLSPTDRQQVEQLVDELLEEAGEKEMSAAECTQKALAQIARQPLEGPGLLNRIADPVAWQRAVRRDRTLPRR